MEIGNGQQLRPAVGEPLEPSQPPDTSNNACRGSY
jgi:hypothetical protein